MLGCLFDGLILIADMQQALVVTFEERKDSNSPL